MKSIFTLFSVMVLSVALVGCQYDLQEVEKLRVQNAAQSFASQADYTFLGCSGTDSDGDGYVTCTAKDPASSSIANLSCSYKSAGAGCKFKD